MIAQSGRAVFADLLRVIVLVKIDEHRMDAGGVAHLRDRGESAAR